MGIVNRDGALYMATGFDNTGMYAGRREAMGIIKAMASQITSFDVFSGIGISAATAFASAAKDSYDFEKEFRKNMLEVATISTQVSGSMTDFMNQVMAITQQIPIKAPEAAKALYQIVSAGHDGAAGMKILEVSAKAAVGGLTDTTTAADAITTVLNAYKMSADEASNISDQLFTTVRLGKTTFGELGQSIAQVAPIAASYGVEIDQVLAAVASLTKQGTPTAQAMTQIRAAIIGTSKELGDGAFETRTFQEALAEVATRANGSESKLRELVPEIEAVNGVLGMTGKNAKAAAFDLGELQNAAGASEAAFGKMKDEVGNQMILLSNNIQAALRPMGQAILKEVSDVARAFNEAFANDDIQNSVKYLGDLIVVLSGAVIGYKGAILASTAVQRINIAVLRQAVLERNMEKVALLNGVVGHHALSAAQLKEIATKKILISAIKVHTVAMLKNISAMAANPYVLAAAAIAALGFVVYKSATQINEADKAQKRFNDSIKESEKAALSEQRELAKLKGELSATTKGTDEYNTIRDKIVSNYGKYDKNLKDEIDKVGLLDETYQNLTKSIKQSFDARQYEKFKKEQESALEEVMSKNLGKIQDRLYKDLGDEEGAKVYTKIRLALLEGKELDEETKATIDKVQEKGTIRADSRIDSYIRNVKDAQKATEDFDKKARVKFGVNVVNSNDGDDGKGGSNDGNKKELPSITKEVENAIKKVSDLKQSISDLRSGKTSVESGKTVQSAIEDKVKELKAAEDALLTLTGQTTKEPSNDQNKPLEAQKKLNEELLSLRLQNQQDEISLMAEGSEKRLTQIELEYDKETAAILAKEKEWKEAQEGKLTEDQTKEIHSGLKNAWVKKERSTLFIDKDQLENEKKAMNEYLAAYGDYEKKRKAITDLYNEKITKEPTAGGKLSLKKQLEDELKSIDLSEFKDSINFADVFGNLDNLTADSVSRLRNKLKEYINKAASGLSPEDLKELSDALSNIEIKAAEKNPFGEIGKSLESYKKASEELEKAQETLNYVMAGGEIITGLYEDSTGKLCKKLLTQEQAENTLVKAQNKRAETLERLNTSLSAGVEKASEYLDVAVAMTGALEDFGVEVPEQLTGFIDGMGKTLDSLASIDLTKPMSVITGAIGAIGGIGKAIASLFNNNRGKEKNIERLQDQTEVLDKTYEKLGESIEKAYSKDASKLIDQQNKLLEQKKVLINQQIAEEEEKKKTDDDRINEWREQLEEIDKTLANNKEKAKDAIFGEDLQSAIDNFAQAYADAWSKGENRSKSAKDTVKNMMRQMVVESIKAAMESSKAMEKIRAKLEEFYADNVLTGWEQDYIYNMAEGLQKELDEQFGWADSLMKDDEEKKKEGVSGQLQAAMTEGTASQLVGLWNSTAIDMRELKNIGIEQRDSVKSIMSDVREIIRQNFLIEQHTRRGADNTDGLIDELRIGFSDVSKRLGTIEKNTKTSNSRG